MRCRLFLLLFPFHFLQAQPVFQPLDSFFIEGSLIGVDRLYQLYIINDKQEISKLDQRGEVLFRFSDNTLGDLSDVDINDPFNVVIFYEEYQTAQILDRTLNPNIQYDFADLGFFAVQSIAMGSDNRIWIYDGQVGQLLQLDSNGEPIQRSQDLNFILRRRPEAEDLRFSNNQLYLIDPNYAVLIFDLFGQFMEKVKLSAEVRQVIPASTSFLALFGEQWRWYNQLSKSWLPTVLPKDNIDHIHIVGDQVFLQQGQRLFMYKIRL